ncbi:MAG: 3-phosphoserine/phosphohydroxythreonine transaminase [Deltaproteobacteria bacterium]|nr:3-phosphoserine/phosphohydroxythreonine transaminase [Deltaproteobacteria bacterium]
MKRAMNFSAGPAALPFSVLEEVQAELLDFKGTGKSLLESSHRSPEYDGVHQETQSLFKELIGLGDDYHVAFFGGGASSQFAIAPMNLLQGGVADYIVTGSWAKKAAKEAKRYGDVNIAFDAEDGKYTRIPAWDECTFSKEAAYLHITTNNTIAGTQYHRFPEVKAPLVADMSSDFLWAPFDPAPFGLIYAGAQKNIGPAGVTVVIIRQDLLERCKGDVPSMFDYKLQVEKESLYNTPPAFPIYFTGKVLKWIKAHGGLEGMKKRNDQKAALLYGMIDKHSGFFRAPVDKESRSMMNVVFRLPSEELEKRFIAEGKEQGMLHLKGHRSVGGIRASIYNAAELSWLENLTAFMEEFARKNG